MEAVALFVGVMGVLSYLSKVPNFDERKRIVEGEIEFFNAKMQDIKRDLTIINNSSFGKKRKRDDCQWMVEGEMFVEKSRRLLRPNYNFQGWRKLIMGLKMRWDVHKLSCGLKLHDKVLGDVRLKHKKGLSDEPILCRGVVIPVNRVVGELASMSLDRLKGLLVDDQTASIAINGIRGIGKTFFMKHLHNYVYSLDRFDHVLWVSCPCQFTIRSVQDAVGAVVKCDFASDDNLVVRAAKLSDTFAKLDSFALFLDVGVLKPGFSLEMVGIPVPEEGSKCKLVLTTNSECKLFDCIETVEIKRLPKEDAYELFMHKANIGKESVSSLYDILCSLADRCCGVPRMIENIATPLRGVDDPCEWRHVLCELEGNLRKKKKCPMYSLCDSHTTSSTRELRVSGTVVD